jgi:hypothetical protein
VTVSPDGSKCRTYWVNTHGCPGVVHEIDAWGVSFSNLKIQIIHISARTTLSHITYSNRKCCPFIED